MNTITEDDIKMAKKAERVHELIANRCTHYPDGTRVITKEFDSALYLERLMAVAKKIASSQEDVSILVQTRRGRQVPRLTRLGEELLLACQGYREFFHVGLGADERSRYREHKLHPYLDVAAEAISGVEATVSDAAAFKDYEALAKEINQLAVAIRTRCKDPRFKAEVKNFVRNAEAKLARALRYLLSLFKKRSRLLVLRVDLYVREEGRAWSYSQEADEAFDKFAAALSSSQIVPDVIGWMSARENGAERGRHYHVLAVLDGHKHHAGANLTRMLGEYWVNECVGSDKLGSYFNCFALADKYKHLGIGIIHFTDAQKLLGLYYATRYLCKDEVQLIATGERSRNFRRGVEDKNYVRLGAPRLKDDDLSLARQVLLGQVRPTKAVKPTKPG